MRSNYLNTAIDAKMQSGHQQPAYRILLFSRWQDSDASIVLGTYTQQPIDLTPHVISGSLDLDMGTDAGSLNLVVSLHKLPIGIFYNCMIQLYEGDEQVDPDEWPATFTGVSIGQPAATEELQNSVVSAPDSRTKRGDQRNVSISFVGRETLYDGWELTSDGVWLPNNTANPDTGYAHRDLFDDVGSIAREFATNNAWGMGLDGDEVLIGPLPYRIEKQLQLVQVSAFEALKILGQPLHLVPQFNGEGKLRYVSERIDLPFVREISGADIAGVPQSQSSFTGVNSISAIGLSKDITEVVKPLQRLFTVSGTFGFFDPRVVHSGTWAGDEQETHRVKVGTVVDGNGATVTSPQFRNFESEGFIPTVSPPQFDTVTEYNYRISIENDTAAVIALMLAIAAAYAGLIALSDAGLSTEFSAHSHPETGSVTGPPSTGLSSFSIFSAAAAATLVAGLTVMQMIGNYSFEVWGVPYETTYEELRAEAWLGHFATVPSAQHSGISTGVVFREWERKDQETKNYILSSLDDSVIPAGPNAGQPSLTNIGLRSWAARELGIRLVEQAAREITMRRDILLEPGDIIQEASSGFRYKIKQISREIGRGVEAVMRIVAYRVP